ncbi:hypothetical protein D6D21_08310 [Aureobasidium pullulans]|uniref:SMP domain-containing protein n=1 Tax=Aureobasidium pullulans TaxID=5580 RepID=A0AB74INJ7_AURPU|nr:hypothetical protein D6D21_08310 [Aureobasidium pullulans]
MSIQSIKNSFRFINTTSRPSSLFARQFHARTTMSAQVPSSHDISAVAKDENGPVKGSQSAQMQSEVGKTQNFESAAQDVLSKMQKDPSSITPEDANYLKSREARATGQAQPPKDSVSADAQRLASANERGTAPKTGPLDPAEQSHVTRERNFEEAVNQVGSKDPTQVTQDDANLLHSREQRAHGHTEKGGAASQAQSIATENQRS